MEVVIEVTVVYVGFNEGIIIEDGQRTSVGSSYHTLYGLECSLESTLVVHTRILHLHSIPAFYTHFTRQLTIDSSLEHSVDLTLVMPEFELTHIFDYTSVD